MTRSRRKRVLVSSRLPTLALALGLAFALLARASCVAAPAASAPSPPAPGSAAAPAPHPVHSVADLRRLSRAELLAITNAVAVEGFVTFASPRWSLWFIADASAGIYIHGQAIPDQLAPGDRVRIVGYPAPGRVAPVLQVQSLHRLGAGPIPPPRPADPRRLLTGGEDAQRISLEGVVRHASDSDDPHWEVAGEFGTFPLLFASPPQGTNATRWIGASIRVHGVCIHDSAPRGFRLLVRDLTDVQLLRAAPADPFLLPLTALERLADLADAQPSARRLRVAATVTRVDPRGVLQIQDGFHGAEVVLSPGSPLPALDDEIELVGFASAPPPRPRLERALWRRRGRTGPLSPTLLDLREIHEAKDGLLVTAEGTFLGLADQPDRAELGLRDPSGRLVPVLFPASLAGQLPSPVEPGTRLRVTGVYRTLPAEGSAPAGHRIEARSARDVDVLGPGSWWTARRATGLAALLALASLAGLSWSSTLRRRLARQRKELELQHAERLNLEQVHRRLTEGAPDAIFTLDARGMFLSANPAALKFSGYSESELLGRPILDLVPAPERPRVLARISDRIRSGGDGEVFVTEMVDRQGCRRYMEVTSRVLVPARGEPCLEGVARDVTERKRAEDALKSLAAMAAREAGDEFLGSVTRQVAQLLEVSRSFIGVVSPDVPNALRIAASFSEGGLLPLSRYELPGSPWGRSGAPAEIIIPREARLAFPSDSNLARWQVESLISIPLAGETGENLGYLVLLHGQPFEPGPPQLDMLRILAARVGSEIARLQATAALRTSEERFRQLAEASEDVLWVVDLPSRTIAYLGPAFARLAGLPAAAAPRTLRQVLRLVHPEDRSQLVATARAGLEQPGARYTTEYRILRTDGTIRWMLDQGVLIRDADARPIRISGVARDITHRKSAELALAGERARFQELFENSPDAVFVESLEGIVLDVNQAACQLHRLPRERIIGRHVTDLVPPAAHAEFRAGRERIKNGDFSPTESLSLRSDGLQIPVELRATRIRHLGSEALLLHVRDISSRRHATDLLRTANAELLALAGSEAVSRGDLATALREISGAAAQSVSVARVSVWILENSDTVLRCVHQWDAQDAPQGVAAELQVEHHATYFAAISRHRLVAISDVARDPRSAELYEPYLRLHGITATLDAGIRLRGKVVGIVRLEHRDGTRAWKTEEELIAGSMADIVAMAVQASERRCIEEALRQSEDAYRSVVGALAEGVMLINREGSFLTYNDSAAEILGLTKDGLNSRVLSDFSRATFREDGSPMPPEDYPAAVTLRTGQPVTDAPMAVRRPDGRVVWLSINTRPFAHAADGSVASVVVSFTDVSRRLEAERALREGNELLQAISGVQAGFIADGDAARTLDLMLSNLIIMTASEHGVVAQIGPDRQAEGFRAFLPDPALGAPPAVTQEIWQPWINQVLDSGRPVNAVVDGPPDEPEAPPRTTHVLALPLRHDEAVVGIVGLARPGQPFGDETVTRLQPLLITCANLLRAMETDRQRQQAEARIRQLNAELEQRVETRTADLKATNQELAEFAYVVTHDLKAPLRGIHQLAEWLAHDHAAQLDAGGLRLLALLRQRVLHLQRLIDGLLACARVGRSPEPERAVPTLDLVRQVVAVIAPPAHITFQIAPDLPTIEGNPDRLHQIFQNVIDNAVKYLDKPRGRIAVGASRERGAWAFRISDNGPGIPERYREKVFQIFQRLHQTGDIPGTGLGLTLVKRIVEARGGRIWIESEGIGTIVCFTWPDQGRPRSVPWEATALTARVGIQTPTPPSASS